MNTLRKEIESYSPVQCDAILDVFRCCRYLKYLFSVALAEA